MTDNLLLDWAIMAISLFNTILLTWLGLTVMFNAERRDWGVWIASIGLLLGALFFVSHTAILGLGLAQLTWRSMIFWWTAGLVPAIMLPYAWYIIMLWYGGYWNAPAPPLRRRQRPWLWVTTFLLFLGMAGLAIGVLLLAVPSPSLDPLRGFIRWSIAGIPLMALGYSIYVLLCIGLSLDALRQPGTTRRVMGAVARRRARPWLVVASVALLVVSLLVAGVMLWIVQDSRQRTFLEIYRDASMTIAWLDLVSSGLIGVAIVLAGQALVSYEVFTGKTLPRRGLLRHWRRTIALAVGYGIAVGYTIADASRPLYSLLLTTMLMTFFYAMVSWRSYVERERYIAHLRPFVSSHRLFEQLLTQSTTPQEVDFVSPFHALCKDVLGAEIAYLAALGPLAPLVGPPIVYPPQADPLPSLAEIMGRFHSPESIMIPLDADEYGRAVWAIPLWSERGLIGVLLLGEKADGGLYTQEEIEIARVIGERLIDTQASAEMARRLMGLQRERLAQSQIIDQQTRRVLHDDILPNLQAAMISLSGVTTQANGPVSEAMRLMTESHKQISDLLHDMPTTTVPEVARLGLIEALRRSVEAELEHAFDAVAWDVDPMAEMQEESIPSLAAEVVFYAAREAVRNAARHGRGDNAKRPLHLNVSIRWQDGLELVIEDDGVGLGNSKEAGSGQGLALHSTMMAVVGGAITVDSTPQRATRVTLTLPLKASPLHPVSASSA